MNFFKGFILHYILFIVFDLIWFSIAGGFFAKQLEPIARISGGSISPRLGVAAMVYLLMALALEYFVFSAQLSGSTWSLAFKGAFLGFALYGVFDLTNRALLAHYPWPMVIVDMAWGTALFFTVTLISSYLRSVFNY